MFYTPRQDSNKDGSDLWSNMLRLDQGDDPINQHKKDQLGLLLFW